jgi:hypothetical protein
MLSQPRILHDGSLVLHDGLAFALAKPTTPRLRPTLSTHPADSGDGIFTDDGEDDLDSVVGTLRKAGSHLCNTLIVKRWIVNQDHIKIFLTKVHTYKL